jgi:hypothetical protein
MWAGPTGIPSVQTFGAPLHLPGTPVPVTASPPAMPADPTTAPTTPGTASGTSEPSTPAGAKAAGQPVTQPPTPATQPHTPQPSTQPSAQNGAQAGAPKVAKPGTSLTATSSDALAPLRAAMLAAGLLPQLPQPGV